MSVSFHLDSTTKAVSFSQTLVLYKGENMDIRFKYATISDSENNVVSGFILCFDTMEDAEEPFRILIKSYEETHIYEKTVVHFYTETDNTCSLHFTIRGDESFEAILSGIESKYVQQLINSVETQGFIFILTAVATNNNKMELNKKKYISTSRIYMDEKIFESHVGRLKFDFNALKEAIK